MIAPLLQKRTPMQCPVCTDATLAMSNREGIEIDYCPKCRGVWLDRGELDKIIDRASTQYTPPPAQRPADPQRPYDDRYKHGKKRRGLLGDLFDFD
jgi:uncharacterized protein